MNQRLPNTLRRNGWQMWHLYGAVIMIVAAVIATLAAWQDITAIAMRDEESSHILLVPLIFAWLVWVRRRRVRQCRPIGLWVGPIMIAIGGAISWIGYDNAIQAFWHGGSLLVVLGAAVCCIGTHVLWRFMPAFVVLGFLIPVPGMLRQEIAIPLQTATAEVTRQVFELMGSHVARSGNVLSINGTEVGIAEACNGLRMVFALALVSYAFAMGSSLRWYVRAAVLGLSPVTAILCNVARLVPTVWFYGNAPEWADLFHDISGWVMLIVAFLILLGVIRVLRWALIPVTTYSLAYD